MRWSRLREAVTRRRDVAEVCRRHGYASVEELLRASAAPDVADLLVVDLVASGPVGVEIALAVLAPWLRRCAAAPKAWSGEDVAELMVAACWERLRKGGLPPHPTRTVPWQSRTLVLRGLSRSFRRAAGPLPAERSAPRVYIGAAQEGAVACDAGSSVVEAEVERRLSEEALIEWVVSVLEDQPLNARIVAESRVMGAPMTAVAEAEGLTVAAAVKRRQRAERDIRASVEAGASPPPPVWR